MQSEDIFIRRWFCVTTAIFVAFAYGDWLGVISESVEDEYFIVNNLSMVFGQQNNLFSII